MRHYQDVNARGTHARRARLGDGLRPASAAPTAYPSGMRVALVAAALLIAALPAAEAGAAKAPGKTQVSITVWPQGRTVGKPAWNLTLACRPPRGTHPAPAQACRRLLANVGALRPVPPGALCGAVSGGPQQATVRGTVNGARVQAALNRRNLCEIRRWDRLGVVLPREVPTTRLDITVWPNGQAKPSFHTSLWCQPAGGTHPRPADACARLLSIDDPFGPAPGERPCLQVSSGPQVAVVRGSFREQRVDTRFDRSDSCETWRWNRVAILFARP
jgi:Subtilisin inhibitor-like